MITYTSTDGGNTWGLFGKESDEKPTQNIPNASTYYEIDGKHRVFMFEADSKQWIEQ